MAIPRVNYVTTTRSLSGAGVALVTSALLLLPQQLVVMLAVSAESTTATSGFTGVSYSGASEQVADNKAADVNPWTADDIVEDLAAIKSPRHRMAATDILRQHPYLGGGKRRAHIFVGKRNKLAGLAAADDAGVDYDDETLPEIVVKRPRMFVGKRTERNDDDIIDDEMYSDDMQRQQDVDKRPRMFVGKRKAPVFVGKRSVDAVLPRRVEG